MRGAYSIPANAPARWNPAAFAALTIAKHRMEITMRARRVIRIQPPVPLGEVTMVPAALCGRGQSETARAMQAALSGIADMPSAADFFARFRGSFTPAQPGANGRLRWRLGSAAVSR
jgi:hypothetical protein